MEIIDVVVLMGVINPKDRFHKQAVRHFKALTQSPDVYIPSAALLECDVVLKNRRFSPQERRTIFEVLATGIPERKVLPIPASVLKDVPDMESHKKYFDALIASTALKHNADVISTDPAFSKQGINTRW